MDLYPEMDILLKGCPMYKSPCAFDAFGKKYVVEVTAKQLPQLFTNVIRVQNYVSGKDQKIGKFGEPCSVWIIIPLCGGMGTSYKVPVPKTDVSKPCRCPLVPVDLPARLLGFDHGMKQPPNAAQQFIQRLRALLVHRTRFIIFVDIQLRFQLPGQLF